MFISCCNRIRNFSTPNRKDHSLANLDIVFSNQRFAAGTANIYFMLKPLETHQLLQSILTCTLPWECGTCLNSLSHLVFLISWKVVSRQNGKENTRVFIFLSTIKKILVRCSNPGPNSGKQTCTLHRSSDYMWTLFFHAKPLSCTFCNLRRRSEIGTSHVAQQDPASWKVHVSIIYACFGPAMRYSVIWTRLVRSTKNGKYMLVGMVFKKNCSIYSNSINHLTKHE